MRGGHNRLPAATKKLRGTLRNPRENPEAPTPSPAVVGQPPKGFSARQRAAWFELAPQVELTFTAADRAAFTLLARLYGDLNAPGAMLKPSAYARLVQIVSGLLQQFGCTPASRGRVAGRKDQDEREAATEAFLFGRPLGLNEFAVPKQHKH